MVAHARTGGEVVAVQCPNPTTVPATTEAPGPRTLGLVHHHINAQTDSTSVVVCPNGIILKTHGQPQKKAAGGLRGDILGWSPASRRRYREAIVRLPMQALYYEVTTLTYPGSWSPDWRRWKRDLHRLELGLSRDWSDLYIGLMWVLEVQKRGAPHYHAFLQCRQPLGPLFPKWLSREWFRIVGSGDRRHLAAGTRSERLDTHRKGGIRQAALYLAKYTGKSEQKELRDPRTGKLVPIGRMWGKTHTLLLYELATYRITERQRVVLSRAIRRWGRRSSYQSKIGKAFTGCLIYGDPSTFRQILRVVIPDAELAIALGQPRAP